MSRTCSKTCVASCDSLSKSPRLLINVGILMALISVFAASASLLVPSALQSASTENQINDHYYTMSAFWSASLNEATLNANAFKLTNINKCYIIIYFSYLRVNNKCTILCCDLSEKQRRRSASECNQSYLRICHSCTMLREDNPFSFYIQNS